VPASRRYTIELPSEAHTRALAAALARIAPSGIEIHLVGELAAGKTAFARGFLRALGHQGAVKSPTFTLVETYVVEPRGALCTVHHFDLYRLGGPDELHFMGFEDYRRPEAICLIEWPSRGGRLLAPSITVTLVATGLDSRRATVEFDSALAEEIVEEFETLVANIK
jgi:tRNA threonylcarbamoyladenosine biosynthesis protein TsaE